MKFISMSFLILVMIRSAAAASFTSTINSIDLGVKKDEPHLIKFDNGRVLFINKNERELVASLNHSQKRGLRVEINQDKKNSLISIRTVGIEPKDIFSPRKNDDAPFDPTIFKNNEEVVHIFQRMRKDYNKEGQCYSRAHVWAFEEFTLSSLQTMKLFMFFTNRYIRKYRFGWWFHVAPSTYVGSTMKILDRRYASGPLQTKTWSDIFIKSKLPCRKVQLYRSYLNNQETQDCYFMSLSMFYLIPRDIEKRDLMGIEKEDFTPLDMIRSYRDAFNVVYDPAPE